MLLSHVMLQGKSRIFIIFVASAIVSTMVQASAEYNLRGGYWESDSKDLISVPITTRMIETTHPHYTVGYDKLLRLTLSPISYTHGRNIPIRVYFSHNYVSDYIVAIESYLEHKNEAVNGKIFARIESLKTVHYEGQLIFQAYRDSTTKEQCLAIGYAENPCSKSNIFFNRSEAKALITAILHLNH